MNSAVNAAKAVSDNNGNIKASPILVTTTTTEKTGRGRMP